MNQEKFFKMEALTSPQASGQLEYAIAMIAKQLARQMDSGGFTDNDIKEYLARIVDAVVDDTIDPL